MQSIIDSDLRGRAASVLFHARSNGPAHERIHADRRLIQDLRIRAKHHRQRAEAVAEQRTTDRQTLERIPAGNGQHARRRVLEARIEHSHTEEARLRDSAERCDALRNRIEGNPERGETQPQATATPNEEGRGQENQPTGANLNGSATTAKI